MTEPLFEVEHPDPAREHQACDRCLVGAWASDDALRVRGWIVFDGPSVTGKELHVRICPACQRKEANEPRTLASRDRRPTGPGGRASFGRDRQLG